jgi:hypothetical protein
MDGETMPREDQTRVDLQSLHDFRAALAGRLADAQALRASLAALRRPPLALGTLPDADYVRTRYDTLHDEHLDRTNRLVAALSAAADTLVAVIDSYATVEAAITADMASIGRLLDDMSGVSDDGPAHA